MTSQIMDKTLQNELITVKAQIALNKTMCQLGKIPEETYRRVESILMSKSAKLEDMFFSKA